MSEKIKENVNDELMKFDVKKRRVGLTGEQKLDIINFVDMHPKISQEKVASHFSAKYKCHQQISRSTISVIIKNRDKFEKIENQKLNKKRRKGVQQ